MNSLGVHRKQSIRHIIDSPKVERWVVENLVQPHPPKMVPLPLGFFPPNCQDDRVGTDATYDAAADLGPSGVCENLWPTIRGYRRELLDRPLNMACSGHVRDSSDYKDRSTLASHCAETGAWNHFAVTPVGEVARPRGYRHTVSALCPPPTASCDTLCAPPTAFCASHSQVDFNQFLSFLMNTSFTACAHGGGVDPAPKAFEALAAGSIPIITSSALDAAYQDSSRTRVVPPSLARTN